MGKKPSTSSLFYRESDVIRRFSRKHWNKAVSLIENPSRAQSPRYHTCYSNSSNPRASTAPGSSIFLMLEMRQALLRHDWSTVCRLYSCLLDTFHHQRTLCNKVLTLFLFSSPTSEKEIFENFCRMVLGLDGGEINVFLKTISRLPSEIPRGLLFGTREKLFVKTDSGLILADAYAKASLKEHVDSKQPSVL